MLQQIGSHDEDPFSYELNVEFERKEDDDFSRSRNTVIFENKAVSRRASPTRPKGADDDEYEELMDQDLNAVTVPK
jgi:hypothetical protein